MALTLFALVMSGLATSTAIGLRLVSSSNGRQLASQLATREIELLRRGNYASIGLSAAITPVAGTLDDNVSGSPQAFLVPEGPATPETVIINAGGVSHVVDPATTVVEGFVFKVHRYVTWVDDPAIAGSQNYKRVTVAAQWNAKTASGGPSRVVMSSLFTPPVTIP